MKKVVRGTGDVLIACGLVVALFAAYMLWGTNAVTNREQDRLREALANGGPGFILHAPKFGEDWDKVVVEGVSEEDLKKGPGRYPDSAKPGEIGNLAIAGHRTTYGAPFHRNDELDVGDFLVVEMTDRFVVYSVTGSEVVTPDRIGVVLPVPNEPGVQATQALITLTTCHPKYSAKQRLVTHGQAHSVHLKQDIDPNNLPAPLEGIDLEGEA